MQVSLWGITIYLGWRLHQGRSLWWNQWTSSYRNSGRSIWCRTSTPLSHRAHCFCRMSASRHLCAQLWVFSMALDLVCIWLSVSVAIQEMSWEVLPTHIISCSNWTSQQIHYNTSLDSESSADLHTFVANPNVFRVEDGHIGILQGVWPAFVFQKHPSMIFIYIAPGLGIDINEKLVREMSARYMKDYRSWRNPLWRGDDGTVMEWWAQPYALVSWNIIIMHLKRVWRCFDQSLKKD